MPRTKPKKKKIRKGTSKRSRKKRQIKKQQKRKTKRLKKKRSNSKWLTAGRAKAIASRCKDKDKKLYWNRKAKLLDKRRIKKQIRKGQKPRKVIIPKREIIQETLRGKEIVIETPEGIIQPDKEKVTRKDKRIRKEINKKERLDPKWKSGIQIEKTFRFSDLYDENKTYKEIIKMALKDQSFLNDAIKQIDKEINNFSNEVTVWGTVDGQVTEIIQAEFPQITINELREKLIEYGLTPDNDAEISYTIIMQLREAGYEAKSLNDFASTPGTRIVRIDVKIKYARGKA